MKREVLIRAYCVFLPLALPVACTRETSDDHGSDALGVPHSRSDASTHADASTPHNSFPGDAAVSDGSGPHSQLADSSIVTRDSGSDEETGTADTGLPVLADTTVERDGSVSSAQVESGGADAGALPAVDASSPELPLGIGGCASAIFGRYVMRTDGVLLFEPDANADGQPPILDAATALPLGNIVAAADGTKHGCAVLEDGTVSCWRTVKGGNSFGQLGSGAIDESGPVFRATPVLLAPNTPLTGVMALAQGSSQSWSNQSCAITDEGRMFCWGDVSALINGGDKLNSPFALPVTVDGVSPLTGAKQASIAADSSYCALVGGNDKDDVYCWGANTYGQLGTGDKDPRTYPEKVLGLSEPSKVIAFGWTATVCVLDGDNVKCWGSNNHGQTGPSTSSTSVTAPTLVTLMGGTTPLSAVVDIQGGTKDVGQGIGSTAVCALTTDRSVKCWGMNFQPYPANYGIASVVALGDMNGLTPRVLTSDGIYHIGASTRELNCSLL